MTILHPDECEKVADFLIDLTEHTDIAKHEPGRIAIKFPLSAYRQAIEGIDGLDLVSALKSVSGIRSYDFSFFWRTLEIVYDSSVIDSGLWKDLTRPNKNENQKKQVKDVLINLLNNESIT